MNPTAPRCNFWTPFWRSVAFVLSATSIWCLLAEFYGLCTMRTFTLFVSVPAILVLAALAWIDRSRGDRRLWNAVLVGATAGLLAAVAYDVFRLPFVFARQLNIQSVVPTLALFKVFPRFGAMILGQPVEQNAYSLSAHLIGWSYHFSNGLTFGIMYLAALGDVAKRYWVWGMVMAAGLEAGMLFTPYPNIFGIKVSATFIAVTLLAHLIFGAVLGLAVRWMMRGSRLAA